MKTLRKRNKFSRRRYIRKKMKSRKKSQRRKKSHKKYIRKKTNKFQRSRKKHAIYKNAILYVGGYYKGGAPNLHAPTGIHANKVNEATLVIEGEGVEKHNVHQFTIYKLEPGEYPVMVKCPPARLLEMGVHEVKIFEALRLAAMEHKNIVRFYGVWNPTEKMSCILLEKISTPWGVDLSDWLNEAHSTNTSISDFYTLEEGGGENMDSLFNGLLSGLQHLHSCDIFHNDLKPQNILMKYDEEKHTVIPKITDFGLSFLRTDRDVDIWIQPTLGRNAGWTKLFTFIPPEMWICANTYSKTVILEETENRKQKVSPEERLLDQIVGTQVNEEWTPRYTGEDDPRTTGSITFTKRELFQRDMWAMGIIFTWILFINVKDWYVHVSPRTTLNCDEGREEHLLAKLAPERGLPTLCFPRILAWGGKDDEPNLSDRAIATEIWAKDRGMKPRSNAEYVRRNMVKGPESTPGAEDGLPLDHPFMSNIESLQGDIEQLFSFPIGSFNPIWVNFTKDSLLNVFASSRRFPEHWFPEDQADGGAGAVVETPAVLQAPAVVETPAVDGTDQQDDDGL